MHRLGDRAEDHPGFLQLAAEGGTDGYRVEYRVHRHAGQRRLLMQRDAELFVGAQQFRVNLVEALRAVSHALRC